METPKVLDFRVNPKTVENPRYRYLRIPLNNIQGPVQITNASQLLEFKLPSVAYNMSRSLIEYSLEIPAQAAKTNWTREDVSLGECFQSVTYGSAGGVNLVDLNYLPNYEKVALKAFTSYEDFISRDPVNSYYPANIIGVADNDADANEKNIILGGYTIQGDDNYKCPIGAGATFVSPFKLTDPKYSLNMGAVNTAIVRNRQLMLSDIKDTFLSEDKDFYCPQEMYLRFQTNPLTKVASAADAGDNPSTNVVSVGAATYLRNVYLYLAVQQNQTLVDELIGSVRNGNHQFTMPFTTVWRNNIAAAGQYSIQIQVSRQYGSKLHHLLTTVNSSSESLNLSVDSSNWNGNKISELQSYLDNRPLTDYKVSCNQSILSASGVNSGDWRENKKFLKNKMMNYGQYQLNWFHMDAFFDPETGDEGLDLTNSDSGLDLESIRTYQLQITSNAAHNLYTYATFLRKVMIDQQGNLLFG